MADGEAEIDFRTNLTPCDKEIYTSPMVRCPTSDQLKELAHNLGFHFEEDEFKDIHNAVKGGIESINRTENIPEPRLPTKYARLPGYRPDQKDNIYNAWYWRCNIQGASEGKLVGKRVAIKDNVAVAGVPMMNGCHALEGFTPDFDATVVTKMLDAGAVVLGKTLCESLCSSGSSSTSAKGPVRNPYDTRRSAGGSSSGSAVVVQSGEADMAIGGDQGGSIRVPASWTGIVGLKPTYGLIPYTGAMSCDMAVDHLGPMARTVHDCALLLEVIAGYDGGMDPRQHPHITFPEYTKDLEKSAINGLKIGILTEGFSMPRADPAVNELVKKTINQLTIYGGHVQDISVPLHLLSHDLCIATAAEGEAENIYRLGGAGTGHLGYYPTSFAIAYGKMFASRPHDLPATTKATILHGEYMKKYYKNQVYCRARNQIFTLRHAYDQAFETVDVLAMPTVPFVAEELVLKEDSLSEHFKKDLDNLVNTEAFDLTGHPALTVNAGFHEGLPVGLMLVGRHYEELTIFKVAKVVEKIRDFIK